MSETTTLAVIDPPAVPAAAAPVPKRARWRTVRLLGNGVRRVVAIAAFLALWQIAPTLRWVDPAFLSPLSEVLATWWRLATSGELATNIWASLHRSLSGFAIAIAIAVPLGLLIAWYRAVAGVLSPLLAIFLNTAAVALLPVFTLILGIGDTSKIAIIAYACFWPVLYNTISGARDVDPLLIKSARSLGLPHLKLFAKVIVPAALPTIFTGIRLAGAASMLVLITTEYVGAKAGLGYLIISAQFNFQIPEMYAGILTVSIIGVAFNYLLLFVEKKILRWKA